MRRLLLPLVALLVVVVQGTWVARLELPLDTPLLFTLLMAWWGGRNAATALGFWTGALVGAMTGTSIAFASLYAVMGWSAATLLRMHPHRGLLRAGLLGAGAALSFQGLESLVWRAARHPAPMDSGMVLAQLLWNGAALAALVWFISKLGLFGAGRSDTWKDWRPLAYGG